jgi:hypothetical protein
MLAWQLADGFQSLSQLATTKTRGTPELLSFAIFCGASVRRVLCRVQTKSSPSSHYICRRRSTLNKRTDPRLLHCDPVHPRLLYPILTAIFSLVSGTEGQFVVELHITNHCLQMGCQTL